MVKSFRTREMPEGELKRKMEQWCGDSKNNTVDCMWVEEMMQEDDPDLYEWLLKNGAEIGDEVSITNRG